MSPHLILIGFFLSFALKGHAQSMLRGRVFSASDGKPVPYAYVFIMNAERYGTLTNEDGIFVISGVSLTDTLMVTHIAFQSAKLAPMVSDKGIEVKLEDRQYFLSEVTLIGTSAESIFQLVKKNLEKNHGVGPVTYDVFARSFQYDKSNRKLFMIQELFSKVNLDSKNKAKVKFERARSKAFVGEDSIFSSHLVFELLFPFDIEVLDWKIWKKNFQKNYTIELTGTEVLDGKTLLQLDFLPKDSLMAAYSLLVDQQTYAVVGQKRYFRYSNGPVHESFFKEVDGLWHVAYMTMLQDLKNSGKNPDKGAPALEQVIVFNISENEGATKEYKGYVNVLTSTTVNWEKTLDPWDHPFWQTYRNIPLPAWIQAVLDKNGG